LPGAAPKHRVGAFSFDSRAAAFYRYDQRRITIAPWLKLVTGGFKDAYETATKGRRDYGVRLIEAGRTNLNAAFDYATDLLSAKSPSEAIEVSTARLRKQLETLSEQSKELATLAQKIATERAEPIREGVNKAFRQAT
jgi:phasin